MPSGGTPMHKALTLTHTVPLALTPMPNATGRSRCDLCPDGREAPFVTLTLTLRVQRLVDADHEILTLTLTLVLSGCCTPMLSGTVEVRGGKTCVLFPKPSPSPSPLPEVCVAEHDALTFRAVGSFNATGPGKFTVTFGNPKAYL